MQERIKQLEEWIKLREEKEIAIVCHSSFIKEWSQADHKIPNCAMHTMELTFDDSS